MRSQKVSSTIYHIYNILYSMEFVLLILSILYVVLLCVFTFWVSCCDVFTFNCL